MDDLAESLVNLYFRDSETFDEVIDFYDVLAEFSGVNGEWKESSLERTAEEILDNDFNYDNMIDTLTEAGYASKVSDAHSGVYLQIPDSDYPEASLNQARGEIHNRITIGSSDTYQEGLDTFR